jgi:hypothetical protein
MGFNRASVGFENRQAGQGDVLQTGEYQATETTAGSSTLAISSIAAGVIRRTGPGGAYTDTTPTAQQIIDALGGGDGVAPGCAFRLVFQNAVAQAMTFAAGEGVLAGNNVNVAASAIRTYLITLQNTTQRQSYVASVTNGAATLSGLTNAQLDTLTVGMMAISAGNLSASTLINSINRATGVVTLSANAIATNAAANVVFSPVVKFEGLFAATA